MATSKLCFVTCLVQILHLHGSLGIRCYNCIGGPECLDPFNKSAPGIEIDTCNQTVSCLKVKGTAGTSEGVERVCNNAKAPDRCEIKNITAGIYLTICTCNADLCNTAPPSTSSVNVLFLLTSILPVLDAVLK